MIAVVEVNVSLQRNGPDDRATMDALERWDALLPALQTAEDRSRWLEGRAELITQIQAEKDKDHQRHLAVFRAGVDAGLSIGVTVASVFLVAATSNGDAHLLGMLFGGAGAFRIARQFVLGYFGVGKGDSDVR